MDGALRSTVALLVVVFILLAGMLARADEKTDAESQTPTQSQGAPPEDQAPSAPGRTGSPPEPPTTTLEKQEAQGVLGKGVRDAAGADMGRIVDVIVDKNKQPRAAIIDFGGFLGVGSRKIAVDWNALRFTPGEKDNRITLDLTKDQVKAAPEYKEGKPVAVLDASGAFEPFAGQ
ncbi:MAG TPA: PRC-barrel domain-containing protein [Xanthobacteraceae bacterium]|jgi:hypothetical protein|nr:PRC-barrel domain-containing protein [Xanthobacteraceae bacterium]